MSIRLASVRDSLQHHGVLNTLYQYTLRLINKAVYFNIFTCVAITKVKESSLNIDSRYEHGFLHRDRIIKFSNDKGNDLTQEFLESAMSKGDECYAVSEEECLASYGWYSNQETLTNVQQLFFCFDPKYIYMYKGLTKKEYRGQKLHAVGMSWALSRYLEKGFSGIVSYVESTNFDSLKSCMRMGYEKIGNIYILKLWGKVFHYSSSSCKKNNIRLKQRE